MELFYLALHSLSSILITYIVGFIFSLPLRVTDHIPSPVLFFVRLALGYILIPTLYSIYFTNGCTILTGNFALLLIMVLLRNPGFRINLNYRIATEFKYLVTCIIVLITFVLILIYRNEWFNQNITFASMQDNGIYTTISEYLKITGIETSSPWYQLFDIASDEIAKVYHYEDLWYFAFVLNFHKTVPLDAYNYIFTSVLATINFMGYYAVGYGFKGKMNITCLYLLSFSFVVFNMKLPFIEWTSYFDTNTLMYPKTASLPILLSLAFISRFYGIKYIDNLAFGALIISDTLFTPTIFGTIIIFYSYKLYLNLNKTNKIQLALSIFPICYYLFFYYLFGSFENSSITSATRGPETYFYYFTKELIAALVKHLVFLLPIYLSILYIWFYKKKLSIFQKDYFIILFGLLIMSSLISSLMTYNVESFQFITNVHTSVSALMMMGCIIILWNTTSPNKKLSFFRNFTIILCFLQVIYSVYATIELQQNRDSGVQTHFLDQVKNNLQGLNKIGIGLTNPDHINSFNIDPRICRYCNFLKQAGEGFWVNQINIPLNTEEMEFKERATAVKLSPFYKYAHALKEENKFTTKEDAAIKFINQYEVDFCVVEKGTIISEKINSCVRNKITDPYSGTTLLFFNRPCSLTNF